MKRLIALLTIAALPLAAPASADELAELEAAIEDMCRDKYVQMEHAQACELGGGLVLGAPRIDNMEAYLVLLDQCNAVYRDSSGDFVAPVSAAALRAACASGVIWTRTRVARTGG